MSEAELEKIAPTETQIDELYQLLLHREHTISHAKVPLFEDHKEFVESCPYRAWYLVKIGGDAVGSFYISNENTVGINIVKSEDETVVHKICDHVLATYTPLPGIKSVRGEMFSINVPPTNAFLIGALQRANRKVLQISYLLEQEPER